MVAKEDKLSDEDIKELAKLFNLLAKSDFEDNQKDDTKSLIVIKRAVFI